MLQESDKEPIEWEKIFRRDISHKDLITRIKILKCPQKDNSTQKGLEKIFLRMIDKQPIST